VIGWAMATHLRTELVLDALNMAVAQRRPTTVIHDSNQGCQLEFNWSSQHCMCEPIVEPHRAPRPVFASRGSFAAWC
jgi:putative transposase